MYFSRKIIPLALLILCSIGSVCADTYRYIPDRNIYQNGQGYTVLSETTARRLLGSVPGFDFTQVWFATGRGDYHNTPTCIVGAGVWAYTKPKLSSPGLWRGRLSYIDIAPDDEQKPSCDKQHGHLILSVPVASFIDPDQVHPEEAGDGYVPGVFHVPSDASDEQLLSLANAISKIRDCLKSSGPCPYYLDESVTRTPKYQLTPALKVENLRQIDEDQPRDDGTRHFEMFFDGGVAFNPDRVLDFVFKDGSLVDVKIDLEITE